jgi:hypothetical protein
MAGSDRAAFWFVLGTFFLILALIVFTLGNQETGGSPSGWDSGGASSGGWGGNSSNSGSWDSGGSDSGSWDSGGSDSGSW